MAGAVECETWAGGQGRPAGQVREAELPQEFKQGSDFIIWLLRRKAPSPGAEGGT